MKEISKIQLAKSFIKKYNTLNVASYSFECIRKSMFQIPKYNIQGMDIYEITFIKKRGFLAFLNRYIVEVVKPSVSEYISWKTSLSSFIEHVIVDKMERKAIRDIICSKHLIIDMTAFEQPVESEIANYIQLRHQISKIKKGADKKQKEHMQLAGITKSIWFENITFAYLDNEDNLSFNDTAKLGVPVH